MSADPPPPAPQAPARPAAAKSPRPRKKSTPAPPKAPATGGEEPAAPMSELPHVHAPQQGIHTWRDFTVHIAVVTIGLLLAIGLQQVVEAVAHRSERAHLEEQMHHTMVANDQMLADNVEKLGQLRGYLVDLNASVSARIAGDPAPAGPSESDPRNFTYFPPPSLGAYEASKANGTVALLSFDTIRLYDRVGITIGIVQADLQRHLVAMIGLRSFAARYRSPTFGPHRLPQVDVAELSRDELLEYRELISNMLGVSEGMETRLRVLRLTGQAILGGVHTEDQLRAEVAKLQGDLSRAERATDPDRP